MRLLITGGAGFIGSNFIRHTLKNHPDYKVFNLDKLTYAGNLENLKDVENNPNYEFVKGDICDAKLVDKLAKGADVIVNFAAESHVDRSILNPSDFIYTNIFGTHALLEAARKNRELRLIHISTDEVYGSKENGLFKEEDALSPNSPYSASKAAADLLVRSYQKTYNMSVIIIRSSNNFGLYQYPEKFIPLFITNALEGKSVPLYGDGMHTRDWLYVLDNCRAIDFILHKGKAGEIYNVGGDCQKANIEIAKLLLEKLNKPQSMIKRVKDRPGHDRRYALDCAKIKALGWKQNFKFENAIDDTINWYKKNRAWWGKIKEKQKEYRQFYKKQYTKLGAKT